MFKYRDKQQLLIIYIWYDSSIHTGVYVHHCYMLQRNSKETVLKLRNGIEDWRSADKHILASASLHPHHCLANSRTFHLDSQDIPGPDSFSRTFQVLEILLTQFLDFPQGMETLKNITIRP